jgi:putative NADPH-quinone reductase
MYNFATPSRLKAWIDRILIPGKTFRYSDTGPVGLAGGRRVIIASSRERYQRAGDALSRRMIFRKSTCVLSSPLSRSKILRSCALKVLPSDRNSAQRRSGPP